jgi:hypothetical protein
MGKHSKVEIKAAGGEGPWMISYESALWEYRVLERLRQA